METCVIFDPGILAYLNLVWLPIDIKLKIIIPQAKLISCHSSLPQSPRSRQLLSILLACQGSFFGAFVHVLSPLEMLSLTLGLGNTYYYSDLCFLSETCPNRQDKI